jgi:hypothetical protein
VFFSLNGWAWNIAVGTEYATITVFGFEPGVALFTFVEPLAGIGRHGFGFAVTAGRTSDG